MGTRLAELFLERKRSCGQTVPDSGECVDAHLELEPEAKNSDASRGPERRGETGAGSQTGSRIIPMRVLLIADEEQIDFDRELRADLLISCGDISDSFIIRVSEMTLCRNIFAVKGNHDSAAPYHAP